MWYICGAFCCSYVDTCRSFLLEFTFKLIKKRNTTLKCLKIILHILSLYHTYTYYFFRTIHEKKYFFFAKIQHHNTEMLRTYAIYLQTVVWFFLIYVGLIIFCRNVYKCCNLIKSNSYLFNVIKEFISRNMSNVE